MKIRFLLVDGLNFIRRIYAAQPGENSSEKVRSTVSTSLHSLKRSLRETQPTHAVAVFDGEGPGWRHALYAGYKAGREPMPEVLAEALPAFREAFLNEGVSSLVVPALEADDVIATMARGVSLRQGDAIILSTDRLFVQLLSDHITLRDHFAKRDFDRSRVRERYGVEPEQFVDLLALAGDATNSIPGVPSIGLKTASRLIADIGSLDDILAVAHTIPGRAGEMIYHHADVARRARELLRLKQDLTLGVNLRSFRLEEPVP